MPHIVIDTLKTAVADDRPLPATCLLDVLFGVALLKQGYTPDQAANYVRREQARRDAVEVLAEPS